MTLWELRRREGTFDVYLPDASLTTTTHRAGINPNAVRAAILDAGIQEVLFQLVRPDGLTVVREQVEVTDLLLWSWVPIFSERARAFLVRRDCAESEFLPCRFESKQTEPFFMHLPMTSLDVVDVSRSSFVMMIPGESPIPHGIRSLALRNPKFDVPSCCFRALVPGQQQVFGELIVSDDFKVAWERSTLTGGEFRLLAG